MSLPEDLTDFVDDPEQARWLHHGMTVAEGFCLDHLPDWYLEEQGNVAGLLATVAAYLWGSSDGLPSWGSLDVAGLLAFVQSRERPIDEGFFVTLFTFYDYLAALHLIPPNIAERIQRDLFFANHALSASPSPHLLH